MLNLTKKLNKVKIAIVVGATGLIGRFLTIKLLKDAHYSVVKIFVRRSLGINDPKLEERIVDFDNIETWKDKISGDELYSAMGTTIKKAGSKEAQYRIDFTYQYEVAKAASENGVKNYFLVSSLGANEKSNNFYLRIKGELENVVSELPFQNVRIFQPSILVGTRDENRTGERITIYFIKIFTTIPFLKQYKPIEAKTVAQAMLKSACKLNEPRLIKYKSTEIFSLANQLI